ncbi:MAG: DUF3000 domain-containing protein [Bifidobacteriaceae bacterium]|jgi:hypothetical protein|nr:DUF3000 domain-containing protein [Bifidobacteriaceae bacterium]
MTNNSVKTSSTNNKATAMPTVEFLEAIKSIKKLANHKTIKINELHPPKHFVELSFAIRGVVKDDLTTNGKLIILYSQKYDPDWKGNFRIIAEVCSKIDYNSYSASTINEKIGDIITEKLEEIGAVRSGGNVTCHFEKKFGEMREVNCPNLEDEEERDLLVRASWTPADNKILPSAILWCELLDTVSQLDDIFIDDENVIKFTTSIKTV